MATTIKTETWGVLAGAYADKSLKACLTHVVLTLDDGTEKTCGGVKMESLCVDTGAYTVEEIAARPTCPVCAKRWDKFHAAKIAS